MEKDGRLRACAWPVGPFVANREQIRGLALHMFEYSGGHVLSGLVQAARVSHCIKVGGRRAPWDKELARRAAAVERSKQRLAVAQLERAWCGGALIEQQQLLIDRETARG